MRVTLGADPEIFLVNKKGKFRSAYGLVPGTKADPFKVHNGAVQRDGMAAEFNIDAVDNEDDWVKNITTVMDQLKAMVPKHEFALVPSCKFHGSHFKNQPDEAKELGCDPDFNAYTLETNPRPNNNTTLRTAAGHVHIGFSEGADITSPEHVQRCATLVKQLDCYLGLPSLVWDKDTKRRSMYGKAGAFRPKPYGVEYRVLSNAWLKNEKLMRLVFKYSNLAVENLLAGNRPFLDIGENRITNYINRSCYPGPLINTVPGISVEEVRECL